MLKTLLPALLLTGLAATALAQPTITAAGVNPVVGDKFKLIVCDPASVLPGVSGANVTWTYTTADLIPTQTDTGRATSCVISTPGCSFFPGSNEVLTGPGIINAKMYIATTSTKRSQIGYYQAPDSNVVYTDPVDELHFPFTYGQTYIDHFTGMLTLGAITAHTTGDITVTADAWGKLILPGRTDDNVLRVHSVQPYTDSIGLFGAVITYNMETYAWYKEGYHSALLTIVTLTSTLAPMQKFVAYAPTYIAGVESIGTVSDVDLYPNPATNMLNVRFNTTSSEQVTVSLVDMLGRAKIIASGEYSGIHDVQYNTAALPRGVYIVRVQAGAETITKKLELQ